MQVIINSVYGDDNSVCQNEMSIDGIYIVNVPEEHSADWKNRVAEVGETLQALKDGFIAAPEDVDYTDYKSLTLEDVTALWEEFKEYEEEGTALGYILNILGWEYQTVNPTETFDADFNEFK